MKQNLRPDHVGPHRSGYEKNRKKIMASQRFCGICGQPVDFSIKYPDPMSPVIDHIIPVSKGGSPDDLKNMQLAHMCCNREKSDNMIESKPVVSTGNTPGKTTGNRDLNPMQQCYQVLAMAR